MATSVVEQATERSVVHSTFVIERNFSRSPEQVFTMFSEETRKRQWFAEGPNKIVDLYVSEFHTGGSERIEYHYVEGSPFTGIPFVNDGHYQEILPGKRIVNASTMNIGGRCISAALSTFEFMPAENGTRLVFTFRGAFFDGSDGPVIREMGWNKLIDQLTAAL